MRKILQNIFIFYSTVNCYIDRVSENKLPIQERSMADYWKFLHMQSSEVEFNAAEPIDAQGVWKSSGSFDEPARQSFRHQRTNLQLLPTAN